MKIAYLTESLPPHKDGVSLTIDKLSDHLAKHDIPGLFISPFEPARGSRFEKNAIKVLSATFPLYSAYRLTLPYFQRLSAKLDRFQPDLIHIMSPTLLGLFGIRYARKRRLPVTTTFHTNFAAYFKYYGFPRFENACWKYLRWFYNRCDEVYVPTEGMRSELIDRRIANTTVIPHAVDTSRFSPAYRNRDLRKTVRNGDEAILLFVGRLVKEKDLDDLVAALHMLDKRSLPYKMVFVGNGPYRTTLARELPDAHFTGFLSGESLAEWFATADIFAFPSTTETFGLVIQEAFASGLPVVAADAGGPKSLVRHGIDGFLVRPNAPVRFADTLQILIQNDRLRTSMGQAGLKQARRITWDQVHRQLFQRYAALIQRNRQQDPVVHIPWNSPHRKALAWLSARR